MRRVLAVGLLCAVCGLAGDRIPKGAKEVEPFVYSYTDAQGNKWMYRQTPFGVTKYQASDVPAPKMPEQASPVTVTDLGDTIRFERTTPFGHAVWTSKKSALTADEKILLETAATTEKK